MKWRSGTRASGWQIAVDYLAYAILYGFHRFMVTKFAMYDVPKEMKEFDGRQLFLG